MDRKKIYIILVILVFGVGSLVSDLFATDWYVDNTAAGHNNGTSWSDAWTSFSGIVWGTNGVKAGDTLYISGGSTFKTHTATSDGMFTVGAAGTSGNLITIATGTKSPSPTGHNGRVIFDAANSYAAPIVCLRNYVKIDGEKSGTINWEVRNVYRRAPYSGAVAVALSNGNPHTGNIVTYLSIHDVEDAINCHAVTNTPGSVEISYCQIYNVIGDHAIHATGTAATQVGVYLIFHNTITIRGDPTQSCYGPDGIQGTYGLDIYNNTFNAENATIVGAQHPDFNQFDFHLVESGTINSMVI